MKAIKVEVFLQPQFIKAAQQYLNTDETLFMTVLPNGLLIVAQPRPAGAKASALEQGIASLNSYVSQYTAEPVNIVQTACTFN